jgi:hypothetical protein
MTAGWWLAIGLAPLALAAASVSTLLLEAFLHRPDGGGSLTTLFPGYVYASATILKVSIGASVAAVVVRWICKEGVSRSAALSLAAVPFAPAAGAVALLIAGRTAEEAAGVSMSYIPRVARTGVLVVVACLAAGLAAGVSALRRRPRAAAGLGAVVNAALLGSIRHFEFYRLGFDQDRWAPPE